MLNSLRDILFTVMILDISTALSGKKKLLSNLFYTHGFYTCLTRFFTPSSLNHQYLYALTHSLTHSLSLSLPLPLSRTYLRHLTLLYQKNPFPVPINTELNNLTIIVVYPLLFNCYLIKNPVTDIYNPKPTYLPSNQLRKNPIPSYLLYLLYTSMFGASSFPSDTTPPFTLPSVQVLPLHHLTKSNTFSKKPHTCLPAADVPRRPCRSISRRVSCRSFLPIPAPLPNILNR